MRKLGTAGVSIAGLSCLVMAIKIAMTFLDLKQGRRPNLVYSPEEEIVTLERALRVCGMLALSATVGACMAAAAMVRDRTRAQDTSS